MSDTEMQLRAECCADWPKPCGYHEGYLDGYDVRDQEVQPQIERLRAANDDLDMACSLRDAEIERLHAVLQGMATVEPNPRLSGPTAGWEMAERLLGMAQAALEADDE